MNMEFLSVMPALLPLSAAFPGFCPGRILPSDGINQPGKSPGKAEKDATGWDFFTFVAGLPH